VNDFIEKPPLGCAAIMLFQKMAVKNHQNPNWGRLISLRAALLKRYTSDPHIVAIKAYRYPWFAFVIYISKSKKPKVKYYHGLWLINPASSYYTSELFKCRHIPEYYL